MIQNLKGKINIPICDRPAFPEIIHVKDFRILPDVGLLLILPRIRKTGFQFWSLCAPRHVANVMPALDKVKPLTYSSYEGIIKRHINPMLGGMELQAVKGIHIQKFYNALMDKGLSGKTVKNVSAVLHKAFSVALKQGYIQTNPCGGAELPKAEHHEIHPLTDEEIPRFLEAIEGNPMRNAFALCLFAGLREGECLGLSWGQVDFQRGRITISQQLQHEKKKGGAYYIAPTTKSGKPRTIEPPPIAFQYLKAERNRQLENRFRAAELWSNPDDLVFTDETGRHLAIMTFYRRFKKIAAAIGRPDARPHDLRHTAATVAIASGADIILIPN